MPQKAMNSMAKPRYTIKSTTTPVASHANEADRADKPQSAYLRAENEDDDGYDPYSDRRAEPPLFEPDSWN